MGPGGAGWAPGELTPSPATGHPPWAHPLTAHSQGHRPDRHRPVTLGCQVGSPSLGISMHRCDDRGGRGGGGERPRKSALRPNSSNLHEPPLPEGALRGVSAPLRGVSSGTGADPASQPPRTGWLGRGGQFVQGQLFPMAGVVRGLAPLGESPAACLAPSFTCISRPWPYTAHRQNSRSARSHGLISTP